MMKLLATLTDQDIIPGTPAADGSGFSRRTAARAVLLNDAGHVALLHVARDGYHKLPGGGVEAGEAIPTALAREIAEETGCQARVTGEIGQIIEYRAQRRLAQTSYCFLAYQAGETAALSLTADEQAHGFALYWADSISHAIALLEADQPDAYDGRFIRMRDRIFLRAAEKLLASNIR